MSLTESVVEDAAIEYLGELGYEFVLTPGRYVGAEEVEDDGEPFEEKFARLRGELQVQFAEGRRLEAEIEARLEGLA